MVFLHLLHTNTRSNKVGDHFLPMILMLARALTKRWVILYSRATALITKQSWRISPWQFFPSELSRLVLFWLFMYPRWHLQLPRHFFQRNGLANSTGIFAP